MCWISNRIVDTISTTMDFIRDFTWRAKQSLEHSEADARQRGQLAVQAPTHVGLGGGTPMEAPMEAKIMRHLRFTSRSKIP